MKNEDKVSVEVGKLDINKMDWIDRSSFSHCVGDGTSHYAMCSDRSIMVTIAKYSDSIVDLKVKMVDFRKDKETNIWMSEKEAQMLLETLMKFYGKEEKK